MFNNELPFEVIQHMFTYMNIFDLIHSCKIINKNTLKIFNHDFFWRQLLKRDFPSSLNFQSDFFLEQNAFKSYQTLFLDQAFLCKFCHQGTLEQRINGFLISPCCCRGIKNKFCHSKCLDEYRRKNYFHLDQCHQCQSNYILLPQNNQPHMEPQSILESQKDNSKKREKQSFLSSFIRTNYVPSNPKTRILIWNKTNFSQQNDCPIKQYLFQQIRNETIMWGIMAVFFMIIALLILFSLLGSFFSSIKCRSIQLFSSLLRSNSSFSSLNESLWNVCSPYSNKYLRFLSRTLNMISTQNNYAEQHMIQFLRTTYFGFRATTLIVGFTIVLTIIMPINLIYGRVPYVIFELLNSTETAQFMGTINLILIVTIWVFCVMLSHYKKRFVEETQVADIGFHSKPFPSWFNSY